MSKTATTAASAIAFVYSTMSNSVQYTLWKEEKDGPKGPRKELTHVLIAGGANVVDKKHLITPKGVMTPVTAEELEMLEKNEVFQRHKKGGFVTIEKKEESVEKVVANQTSKDSAAQIDDQFYKDNQNLSQPRTEEK